MDDININGHCLVASKANIDEDSWLWHRRLGYACSHLISKLIKKNLVNELPNLNLESNHVYKACQLGKHTRTSFKSKYIVSTTRPLELLHMDLFGSTRTTSLGGKKYGLVIVDDYSRYTWVSFVAHKNETFSTFLTLFKRLTNEKNTTINSIRTDHGSEFDNIKFEEFGNKNGIEHNFSAPRIP